MEKRPWWDAAVAATVLVCALLVWLTVEGPRQDSRAVGAWIVLGIFLALYVGLGRWQLGVPHRRRTDVFLAAMIVVVGAATAANGNLASLQVIAYPLIGCLAAGALTGMLLWDVALGVAVFLGGVAGHEGVVASLLVAVLSLAFAMALGTWILRVARWGEERAVLLARLRASQERAEAAAREAGAAGERERLARDMHDTVAQSLTGIVMLLERARRQADRAGDAERDRRRLTDSLDTLEAAAREALGEVRALIAETTPVGMESGLADAARRVGARFERETGVAVSVDFDDVPLDRDRQVVLLRCLQEALGNVRKHASAGRVEASLHAQGDRVLLAVADDGVGLPSDGVVVGAEGFGLAGMRDRVRSVGGDIELAPGVSQGTTLRASVPLPTGAVS